LGVQPVHGSNELPFACEKLFRRDVDIGEWVNDCRHFYLKNSVFGFDLGIEKHILQ